MYIPETHLNRCKCGCNQTIGVDGDDVVMWIPLTDDVVAYINMLHKRGVPTLERRVTISQFDED